MRKLIIFSLALSMCLLLTGTLFSQETGEISGKVIDEEGTVLPGVSIMASSPSLQGRRSTNSKNDGSFKLPLLPIGKYILAFELQGFARVVQENVEVRLGMVTSINVTMKVATIAEQITVIAQAALIDKTKADTSFNVGERELASAPIQARTIQEIIHYTPGVTSVRTDTTRGIGGGGTHFGGASFRGGGETSNNWFVDGLSKRGAWEHREGVRVNYDSWEEVQVISDPFSPELGQTYGGIINIVTKTGGNEFHGELGALILDDNLRASRQDQLAYVIEPERSTYNYFGNIGGPIVKDKLWFFISDNYWRNAEDGQSGSFGWLSYPEGKLRTNTNNFFGKLTFALAQNHTISVSGTYDKFLSQSGGIGLPERYTKADYENYAYRLSYKGIFGSNTLIEAVIGRSSQHRITEPLSGETGTPSYYFLDIAQYTNNAYGVTDITDRRLDFTTRFTQYLDTDNFGNHEIGLGFLYYHRYKEDLIDPCGEDWDVWPGNGYDAGCRFIFLEPGVPTLAREDAIQNFHNKAYGFGFYLKDKVTIGRLSVMFGIRAETQKLFNDVDEVAKDWGLNDFLSPRFSLAWDITGDGVNVFKVGVGQFVDTVLFDFLGYINLYGGYRAQFFRWIGPTPIQDDEQLRDPSNWVFSYRQGPIGEPAMVIHEDATPEKMTRVIVEFDRRLGPNWALKLRGVYSNHHDMLEDLAYFTYDSDTWRLENWDQKRRNYAGFEVEVNGRFSDRLFLNSSYVWSKAKGSVPGAFEREGNWSGVWAYNTTGVLGDHYSGPADSPLAWLANWGVGFGGKDYGDEGFYGVLPYSCDHVVKILATYLAPYGFNITAGFEWYSGYYWSIRGIQADYGQYWTFPHGRGTEKAPAHSYFDLSVQKDFALPGGVVLGLRVNATNLFNSQEAISFMNGEGSVLFGQVFGRQYPRWFQLQALLRF
jgi:hypothetical protein